MLDMLNTCILCKRPFNESGLQCPECRINGKQSVGAVLSKHCSKGLHTVCNWGDCECECHRKGKDASSGHESVVARRIRAGAVGKTAAGQVVSAGGSDHGRPGVHTGDDTLTGGDAAGSERKLLKPVGGESRHPETGTTAIRGDTKATKAASSGVCDAPAPQLRTDSVSGVSGGVEVSRGDVRRQVESMPMASATRSRPETRAGQPLVPTDSIPSNSGAPGTKQTLEARGSGSTHGARRDNAEISDRSHTLSSGNSGAGPLTPPEEPDCSDVCCCGHEKAWHDDDGQCYALVGVGITGDVCSCDEFIVDVVNAPDFAAAAMAFSHRQWLKRHAPHTPESIPSKSAPERRISATDSKGTNRVDPGNNKQPGLKPTGRRMNKTESRYALILEARKRAGEIDGWEFAPLRFDVGLERCTYRPDFLTWGPEGAQIIEVKGAYIHEDSRVKFQSAAKQYPWLSWKLEQWKKGEWRTVHHYGRQA